MFNCIYKKFKIFFTACQQNQYRPKFLESDFLFYLVILLLILKILGLGFFIYIPEIPLFADITKNTLISFANQERIALGFEPLSESYKLNEAAQLKAKDMLENNYFSHENLEGEPFWSWFEVVGYNYKFAGENLAIGFLDSQEVHQAWLESELHRQNILNPEYKEIGMAVARGDFSGNETTLVVQLLARPNASLAAEDNLSHIGLEQDSLDDSESLVQGDTSQEDAFEKIVENESMQSPVIFQSESVKPVALNINQKLSSDFLGFLYFDYDRFVKSVSYVFLVLTIFPLGFIILRGTDKKNKDLILRAVIFIILFSAYIAFDKEIVIYLTPHDLII